VKAVDKSLNHSAYSPEAKATATGGNVLLAQYQFEDNSKDNQYSFCMERYLVQRPIPQENPDKKPLF
jgi:hypothetical protein